jgi:CDP-diacylglycerol--serine O-phosphatidyltransferase
MLRFLDVANGLTLVSLTAAVACALLAVHGLIAFALVALILSGLCDLFDGWVARRLKRSDEQKRFGGRLDSVVDACAFGFAPVVLLHCSGLQSPGELALLGLFAACVAWRLAYFDAVTAADGPKNYHEGLPATYVALILPLTYLLKLAEPSWLRGGLVAATASLALAMVCTVHVPRPRGAAYAVFLAAGVISIAVFLLAGSTYDQTP